MWGPVRFGDGAKSYTLPNPQSIRDNFGDTQAKILKLPGMAGGYDIYGLEAAPGDVGKIRLDFELFTSDQATMTSLRDAVKRMVGWGVRRLVYQPTEPTDAERWCWARVEGMSAPEDMSRTAHIHKISVDFITDSPYWYSIGTEGPLWGTFKWAAVPWGPTATKHAITGSSSFTITPDGSAETLARIICHTTTGQGFTNPIFRRYVDSVLVDELVFTDTTVDEEDCLIINPRKLSVKKGAVNWYPYMTALHPAWFRLEPGVANDIEVAFGRAVDSASVQVAYYELWR